MGKTVLITGISSGIGKATAIALLEAGYHVFGSVRNPDDTREMQYSYPDLLHPLVMDVRNERSIADSAELVKDYLDEGDHLQALINNAGIAVGGPLMYQDMVEFKRQLDVNVTGVLSVTKAFLPLLMAADKQTQPGRIINISSVSGRRAIPFTGPYVASKYALEGLSDSLRIELMLFNIPVVLVEPGPVQSEIWRKVPDPEDNPFVGSEYESALRIFYDSLQKSAAGALPASVVAGKILKILAARSPKSRYVITRNWFTHYFLPRILPTGWVDKMIAKQLGLLKKSSH